MRRALVSTVLALAALCALAPARAWAQAIPPEQAQAVREVIEAQLEAFRRDDAERAFSLAAPGIRAAFATPENFMEMVKGAYAVVYRPASVAFEAPMLVEGQVVQPVRMTDAQGRPWIAIYPMQRMEDGSWRINGCQLGRIAGSST